MPAAPQGFEAWIEVEGRRLEEFKVELKGDKMICWVPCDPGKEFRIGCTIPAESLSLKAHSVHARLDGNDSNIGSNLFYHAPDIQQATTRYFAEEWVKNGTATRTFQFGSLQLTDDDSYLHITTKRFGEISVRIRSVEGLSELVPAQTWPKPEQDQDHRIHERAKKGLAHCVKFGAEKPSAPALPPVTPIGSKVVFTFVFNYRHIDILIADGIAPRNGPPQGKENAVASSSRTVPPRMGKEASRKRTLDEVKEEDEVAQALSKPTDDDIQRVEAQLAEMKAKKAQAAGNGSQPTVKRMKKEHKASFVPGEIIDLTNHPSRSPVKREPKSIFVPGEVIDLT